MAETREEFIKRIVDVRYDFESNGVPSCGLIEPREVPADSFTCPDCGTIWIKITQFGQTVWSTHKLNDGQPRPEGSE